MALRNTWDDSNKVKGGGRLVKYSAVPEFWDSPDGLTHIPIYWTITRTSTMDFTYIGLTESAAESCAKAIRDEYTRNYMRWTPRLVDNGNLPPTVLVDEDTSFECTSSIAPQHAAGDNWEVSAGIEETDVIISVEEVTDIADLEALFQVAEQREHTWPGGSIAITTAKWVSNEGTAGVVKVDYSPIVTSFDRTKLSAEVKSGQTWTAATTYQNTKDGHFEFEASGNVTFRLTYNSGAVVSKEWTTKNMRIPTVTMLDAICDTSEFLAGWEDTDEDKRMASLEFRVKIENAGIVSELSRLTMDIYQGGYRVQAFRPVTITAQGDNVYLLKYRSTMSYQFEGAMANVTYLNQVDGDQVPLTRRNYLRIDTLTIPLVIPDGNTYRFSFSAEFSTDYDLATLRSSLAPVCLFNFDKYAATDFDIQTTGGHNVATWTCVVPKINPSTATAYTYVDTYLKATIADKFIRSNTKFMDCPEPSTNFIYVISATHEDKYVTVKFSTDIPMQTWLGNIKLMSRSSPTGIWSIADTQMGLTDDTVVATMPWHMDYIALYLVIEGTEYRSNEVLAEIV